MQQSYEKISVSTYGIRGKGWRARDNPIIMCMKALHLLAATAWAGGALSMQALSFLRLSTTDTKLAAELAFSLHFIDTWVVMPGLGGCILTGLFYSICTSIGFFKFAWIGYKWLVTICAGFWGIMFWGPWGDNLIQALIPHGLAWPVQIIRACILPENMWEGGLQLGVILSMCMISVFRPLSFRPGKSEIFKA